LAATLRDRVRDAGLSETSMGAAPWAAAAAACGALDGDSDGVA
jgi:hypothetical protein